MKTELELTLTAFYIGVLLFKRFLRLRIILKTIEAWDKISRSIKHLAEDKILSLGREVALHHRRSYNQKKFPFIRRDTSKTHYLSV